MIRLLFFLILFFHFYTLAFSQGDSLSYYKTEYRLGFGIYAIPGLFIEHNLNRKLSIEGGLISVIFFNEAALSIKRSVIEKGKFKFKVGIGTGMTAYFWSAKTDPPKSGEDIFILAPLIPLDFRYGRFSLEIAPSWPIKLSGEDEAAIPVIVFLSFVLNKKVR